MSEPRPPTGANPGQHRIWLLIALACVVPALLDTLQTWMQARLTGESVRWQNLVFQGAEWLFLGALTPIAYFLGQRYPLGRGRWKRALPVHVAGAFALCLGWASLGLLLGVALQRYPAQGPLPQAYLSWILTSVPWSVFMYFTVLGCVHAFRYFLEARERELQASRLTAQLAEARLGALRMQLNPHFLFNSLNALLVLVRDGNQRDAARVLELLGDVLRQALRSNQPNEVPLSEELAFIEQYLAIEQVRFSDRLDVRWRIDEAAREALVPGFVLQPLVENAIKHGVAKRADAGKIEIAARASGNRLQLSVRDDGVGFASPALAEEGIGLSNTKERLRTMYGAQASLALNSPAGGGAEVVLTLPLRTGQA